MAVYGAVPVAGCQLAYFSAVEHVPVGVALLIGVVTVHRGEPISV